MPETNFDILVSSTGGVGSTFFMDFVLQHKNINRNHFPVGTNIYKHAHYPPDEKFIKKAVFMYGNPYNAVLSINRRKLEYIHLKNRGKIRQFKDLDQILNLRKFLDDFQDPFGMEDQLNNWLESKTSYSIMFLKYETLWNHLTEIFNYLDIDQSFKKYFPDQITRNSNWNAAEKETKILLEKVYGSLKNKVDKLPDVMIRN